MKPIARKARNTCGVSSAMSSKEPLTHPFAPAAKGIFSPARFPWRVLALAGLLAAPGLQADEFHYRDILIGTRASAMGGAYTAISDDPSGLYYNPAGIVHADELNLSGSVNAWHRTTLTYEDVLADGQDWRRESGALIPNFFGITQPVGPGVFGFSYVVTDAIQEDQDQTFLNIPNRDRFTINLNNTRWVYKLGPSYAIPVSDTLSVGMTLYFQFREEEQINNQMVVIDAGSGPGAPDADVEWRYIQQESNEWGIKPVFGVMWEPLERLAIGASIRHAEVVSADNSLYFNCSGASVSEQSLCPENAVNYVDVSDETRRDHPWEVRVGATWFHSPKWLISADVSYHTGFTDSFLNGNRVRDVEGTFNLAVGTEYYLTNQWAVRGGLFTNRANTPETVVQYDHVDLYGFSASIARFTRNSSLDLGFSYSFGGGKGQVFTADYPAQDLQAENLTIFLSSSYSF